MKIGILGGGQLARMLCLAGYPLGMEFRILDPTPDVCAAPVAEHIVADYEDGEGLTRFADGVDVVTYEFENVPMKAAAWLAERVPVFPPSVALEKSQDRLLEKTFLQALDVPVPLFAPVNSFEEMIGAVSRLGLPAVLKTRRFGYDGKGQCVLREFGALESAWQELNHHNSNPDLILEGFVDFDRELSLLAVRGRTGEIRFYPLVENQHENGILRVTRAPAPDLTPDLQQQAENHMRSILEALNYVGILAIEFFQTGRKLIANEMAPRVHNSGHWTIEGAATSQFENHLRAITGLPLGSTACIGQSIMHNIIGEPVDMETTLSMPDTHLHLYGKAPRPGRKIGHITCRTIPQ